MDKIIIIIILAKLMFPINSVFLIISMKQNYKKVWK